MKIKKEIKEIINFKPIELTITIENKEELNFWYQIYNLQHSILPYMIKEGVNTEVVLECCKSLEILSEGFYEHF